MRKLIMATAMLLFVTLTSNNSVLAFEGKEKTKDRDRNECTERYDGSDKPLKCKGVDAAEILGIDKAELEKQLEGGAKLYDILVEAGKLEEYKQAVLEAHKAKLDELVNSGKITGEEAGIKYEELKAKLDNWGVVENKGGWNWFGLFGNR